MQTLKPIFDKDRYHAMIEEEIKRFFYQMIYLPILEIARDKPTNSFENAKAVLLRAIRDGKIAYVDGFFVGEFNSAIGLEMRKLGAQFNSMRKAYAIDRSILPMDVKLAISDGSQLIKDRTDAIYKQLNDLQLAGAPKSINFNTQVSGILVDLDKQFSSTVTRDLSVPMQMTPLMQDSIKKNYTENLNLYIKDWYDKAIIRLREKVHKNVEEGFRASHLIPIIQAEKNVSYRKAKFLAKQETSLLVSKYREERYTRAGLKRYKWLTSEDSRVRPTAYARAHGDASNNHRILNGKIFSWDEPPIVDSATGRRCNPGEDYGCRCVAVPIIE